MSKRNTLIAVAAAFLLLLGAGAARGADPVAVADGQTPGLRAEITELKRTSGNTVTLRLVLINESGRDVRTNGDIFGANDLRHVHLIDAAGKKKYLPVMDSQKQCVCSSKLPYFFKKDEKMNLWARFPAPPDDVTEVSVVLPRFIPTDVPIGK